jgi:monovalent cation:H+ antiporter, CPA1 family
MGPVESIHVETLLALLLAASATAVIVKWVRVPYAVALVIAGLIIGVSRVLQPVALTPELVLLIFLPALLFESSWNLDIKALRRDWISISALATIGVVVCMFGVAAIMHFAAGMNVRTALLFGAMVSATDPVSVIALFRQMGVDRRLTMIVEGESIFNDGTAVVLFKIVLALCLTGAQFSLINTAGDFFRVVFAGALLGALLGYVASKVTSAFDDHLLEITLTVVTAYGAYLLADQLHVSPVIAVVAAGIVLGNYGSRAGMSASTRLAVSAFWEYAVFLVNSLLFLLIGLQVQMPLMLKHAQIIGLAVLALIISRLLVIYGICPFVSTARRPIPDKWRHIMFWAGLRGALVMALALSLPLVFPDREILINMTFGVVLFTLLVPGLTMEPLVQALGMAPRQKALNRYQQYEALLRAYRAESQVVTRLKDNGQMSAGAHDAWQKNLQEQILDLAQKVENLQLSDSSIDKLRDRQSRIHLLENRKDYLSNLVREGILNRESAHELCIAVDSELDLINRHESAETASPEGMDNLPNKDTSGST